MTKQERSDAIDKARAELKEVQRRLRVTEKEHDRLLQRAQHLNREIDAMLTEHNNIEAAAAWGES